ncbi:MAG TPA: cytochrome c biogenesis protein CcdA, partial [Casimicrobiaceae bacterium]
GASLLRQLLVSQHGPVFVAGGVLMLGLAAFVLLGGKLELPMPSRQAGQKAGPLGIYSLGVFSGIASSCCAPVLAGVLALSSLAPSTVLALALGTAYVFGMVAPLFAITLLWERYDWRASRLFRPRSVTWRIGRLERTLSMSAVATGALLALMGVATIWAGLAADAMPSGGWWMPAAMRLQYYGQQATRALVTLPGWLTAAALIAAGVWLARRAFRQFAPRGDAAPPETPKHNDQSRSNP